jgi:hypothetical protein
MRMKQLVALLALAYLSFPIVQMFAIADGLAGSLHVPFFFSLVCAMFLTLLPLIGPALGAYGAAVSWGWPWLGAALFFVSPLLIFALMMIIAVFVDETTRRYRVGLPEATE